MSTLITILHVIVCLFLMLTVLLQSGKGGGMGAAFGGGNAATVFGGSGASSFLRRLTAGAGTIFMLTSMLLAFIASHNSADSLEKFGEQQANLAEQKDKAKEKALEDAKKNAGSGSAGSASTMPESGSNGLPTTIKLPNGSDVPFNIESAPPVQLGSGSATAPVVPAEKPATPAEKAPAPVEKPAEKTPAPAEKTPATPTPAK